MELSGGGAAVAVAYGGRRAMATRWPPLKCGVDSSVDRDTATGTTGTGTTAVTASASVSASDTQRGLAWPAGLPVASPVARSSRPGHTVTVTFYCCFKNVPLMVAEVCTALGLATRPWMSVRWPCNRLASAPRSHSQFTAVES